MSTPIQNENAVSRITINPPRKARDSVSGADAARPDNQGSRIAGNTPQKTEGKNGFWGRDGFSFGDLIDLVNPFQHIPIISTIYRAVTGDEIGVGPRLIGGALMGGAIGLGAAAVNAAVENQTGSDIGQTVVNKLTGATGTEKQLASLKEKTLQSASGLLGTEPPVAEAKEELAALPELTEAQKEEIAFVPLTMPGSSVDGRMAMAMGGLETAHQQYRQVQALDALNKSAVSMQG